MSDDTHDDAGRALHFLVADALESLIPLVDAWGENVKGHPRRRDLQTYSDGYYRGVDAMAAEVKDQLVERVLRLRA